MFTRLQTALCTAAIVLAAGLSACGSSLANTNSEASLGSGGPTSSSAGPAYHDSWEGSSSLSNPAADPSLAPPCAQGVEPSCDIHRLDVPAGVQQVLVAIKGEASPAEDAQTNDFDLYVYDDQNNLIAYAATETGNESLVFDTTGSAYYEVRVASYVTVPGSAYQGMAKGVSNQAANDAADCLEAVPATAGLSGITDAGQTVELSVHLLLDGTTPEHARDVMARAAKIYAPLDINLTIQGMTPVTVAAKDPQGIVDFGKAHFGGRPPAGADLVVIFTSKVMEDASSATGEATTTLGFADCIGGVRFPHHAFAAVSDTAYLEDEQEVPGFYLYMNGAAETLAHEMGHLMGAQHHYGNCVEGIPTSEGPGDVSPCTLMFPLIEGISSQFGTLEGLVVRGHAVEYASP